MTSWSLIMTLEYLPAPQLAQVEAAVAPTAAENLPASQLVQPVEAMDAEYFPSSHFLQVEALQFAYLPAPQSAQVDAAVAPENLPASHEVQPVEAMDAEYSPVSQSMQKVHTFPLPFDFRNPWNIGSDGVTIFVCNTMTVSAGNVIPSRK
jgi:hypothetical protein